MATVVSAQDHQIAGTPGHTVVIQPGAGGSPLITFAPAAKSGKHGVFPDEKVMVAGRERLYRLVVPDSLDAAKPVPLVLAFHPLNGTRDGFAADTKLDDLAKSEGFIIVYPEFFGKEWPHWTMELTGNRDVDFFDSLYPKLLGQYNIDRKRVYALGHSNGAYFVHVLAALRSDKIAAIAAHSGGLGYLGALQTPGRPARGIRAAKKYAAMIIQGTADQITKPAEAIEARDMYLREGHVVEYLEIPGLGHQWANAQNINAKIWDFFQKHPLKNE